MKVVFDENGFWWKWFLMKVAFWWKWFFDEIGFWWKWFLMKVVFNESGFWWKFFFDESGFDELVLYLAKTKVSRRRISVESADKEGWQKKNESWNVSTDFDLWLERRAELGTVYFRAELQHNICHTIEIIKVCWRGQALYSLHADLRNRVVAWFKDGNVDNNQWGHANSPERALYLLRFLLAMTHTNTIRQELNCNESATFIDAHLMRCKFCTEDDNCCHAVIHRLDNSSATSLVKDQGQNCRMYSTTEGIAVKTQQIIHCDATDDDCNGIDLITNMWLMQGVSSGLPVSTVTLSTRSREMNEMVVIATAMATTTDMNKFWNGTSSKSWWSVPANPVASSTKSIWSWKWCGRETRRSVPGQEVCAFPVRTTHITGPLRFKHHQNSTKGPPRESSAPYPSGPPPLQAPTPSGPHQNKIAQMWYWPNSVWPNAAK